MLCSVTVLVRLVGYARATSLDLHLHLDLNLSQTARKTLLSALVTDNKLYSWVPSLVVMHLNRLHLLLKVFVLFWVCKANSKNLSYLY